MRSVTVGDWLALEREGLLEDGQIRGERATEAAVIIVSRCAGLTREAVEDLPVNELWRLVREATPVPFPEPAQGT